MPDVQPHRVECLVHCSCPSTAVSLLDFVSQHEASLQLRQHPLGFLDVVPRHMDLRTSRFSARRLAIHVWHELGSVAEEPRSICHSHGWGMTSVVRIGALINNRYRVEPAREGNAELFEVTYPEDQAATLHELGPASVELHASETMTTGIVYQLAAGEFHESASAAEVTATTMIACAPMGLPMVVYAKGERPSRPTQRPPLDGRQAKQVLSDVISRLLDAAA